MDRRLHDIAADQDSIEPFDVVVLHRVVCCYPDCERCWVPPRRTLASS